MSTTRLYDARTRVDSLTDVLGSVGAIAEELSRGIAEVESERDTLTREVRALRLDLEVERREIGTLLSSALAQDATVERLTADLAASREAQAKAQVELGQAVDDAKAGLKWLAETDRKLTLAREAQARAERERDEARLKLRIYENGASVNQPLVDDIDRWRVETEAIQRAAEQQAEEARASAETFRQAAELNRTAWEEARARCATLVEAWRATSLTSTWAFARCARELEAALASASPAKPHGPDCRCLACVGPPRQPPVDERLRRTC